MKLRAISLSNVRKFTGTHRIDEIGDGLNIFCEPNETGKSTIFDALQALFFKAHGSRDKDIMSLRPHAGGAPEVTVEVETPAGRFTLSKRWVSKAEATVRRGDTLVAQSDAAEAWIARLIGDGAGDPSGLVWVRQGLTGLGGGSKKEEDAALAARANLMLSVAGEVEAITGGQRMDAALARCREDLGRLETSPGRAKAGGPLKIAQERVTELEAEASELTAKVEELRDALDARRRARRDLAELEDPEAITARQTRLAEAEAKAKDAERHAERLQALARDLAAAEAQTTSAQEKLLAYRAAATELTEATKADTAARTALEQAKADHDAARDAAGSAADTLRDATEAEKSAADMARKVRQAAESRANEDRRKALTERIAQAEAARQDAESAAARARIGPTAKDIRALHQLANARDQADAARTASATRIEARPEPGRDSAFRLDGEPLGQAPVALRKTAILTVEGLGQITIHPGALPDTRQVEEADRKVRAALDALGMADIASAETAAEARDAARQDQSDAEARFAALAPEGLEALRDALAALPPPASDIDGLPDPEQAEATLENATKARITAQEGRDRAEVRLAAASSDVARAEGAATAAQDRLTRATRAADRFAGQDEATLAETLRACVETRDIARATHDAQRDSSPDLDAAKAALTRARAAEDNARSAISRLRPEIAALDEHIRIVSGQAVEERLHEVEQSLAAARDSLTRVQHDVAVLRRLEAALDAARTDARDRYFEPVAAELKPLLAMLWPDADLTWSQDTLLPDGLIRNGQPEPIDVLSGGTQEQIALMVRLAFARMLARSGRHAPVILDDALVYTDDDRIEVMFDTLHRQASDIQIVVFTCRQRAFRDLGAHSLRLSDSAG